MKRKIFAMLLALVMVFSMATGAFAAESRDSGIPALLLEVTQGKASATVSVYVKGCEGVSNGSFSVSYDSSVFNLAGTQTTNAYAKNSVNTETAGKVSFAWVGSELGAEKTLMLTLTLEALNGSVDKDTEYSVSSEGIFAGTEDVEADGDSHIVEWRDTVDTSELEKAIDIAESLNKEAYSALSWSALEEALAKAIAVLANSDSTQSEIDAATAALNRAINSLVPSNGSGVEVITPGSGSSEETENPGTGSDFSFAAVAAVIVASVAGIFVCMKNRQARKFLCLILAVTMILTVAPMTVFAQVVNGNETERSEEKPTDLSGLQQAVEEQKDSLTEPETEQIAGSVTEIENPGTNLKIEQNVSKDQIVIHKEGDMVRVIVELEGKGLLEQGYTQSQISAYGFNVSSDAAKLEKMQNSIAAQVEELVKERGLIEESERIEVRYNFTIALNGVSMDVPYGAIDDIKALDGVKNVYAVTEYNVPESVTDTVSPAMYATSETFGSAKTWKEMGYTGEGMVIAVVDTGIDLDHPSFVDAPKGATMTVANVEKVLTQLNAYELYTATSAVSLKASQLYRNPKVPFGFNYADKGLDITHDYDQQGDHGSHVAGICAANEIATTDVVGVAPNAQLVIMKVFGQRSTGAGTDDIIAAIEDCLLLEVDVVNMSLGSPAGFVEDYALVNEVYGRVLKTDMILAVAAGNSHSSSIGNALGTNLNYTQDPDNGIVTSPGTYLAATTVASLENTAMMMPYFTVGENRLAYVDVTYSKFAALEGTYEYVIVPGIGQPSDYEGLDVNGKIAVVKRGTIDFTAKQEAAFKQGAKALVVYDNVIGDLVSMYDAGLLPNVFISKADGEIMIAAAENGVGTMTIMPYGSETAVPNSVAGLISDFSSWGVTSDLQLTPDVAAPGGNIYSCFTDGHYGTMSGTSMACPHIAGMSALVLEYLHDKYPTLSGEQYHTIAESLVMSTAVPVYDENGILYTPRAQGAGSANVYSAVKSPVYLTSYQKSTGELTPKGSLGDDPERTGVFTFTFTMNNLSDKEQTYALDGMLLTDQYFAYDGKEYMGETGKNLSGKVTFEAQSAGLMPLEYDVNKDGVTDMNDVQYMLDYVNGVEKELDEVFEKVMNFCADEELNTADVQIFYEMVLTENVAKVDLITVPANGSVEVTATVTLSAEDMAYMDAHYPAGIYVDGFVRAYAQTEGAVDLSFPFVGFYGEWSDARMFDSGWYYEDHADTEYNRYWNVIFTTLGADENSMGGLGLNPYLADDPYTPAHNVLSPNGDTYLDYVPDIYVSLMRSAKVLEFIWTDAEGNELFYDDYEYARKSFYWSAYGLCLPAMYIDGGCVPFTMYDENGNLMVEDLDKLTLTIRGYLDDGDIKGVLEEDSPRPDPAWADEVIEVPVTIDISAPKIDLSTVEYYTKDGRNYISFDVEDNYDIAAVVTMTEGGSAYEYIPVNTKAEGVDGEKATLEIDITEYDAKFQLIVCDYGCNETYYELTNEANTGLSGERFFAYRRYSYVEYDGYMYATDQLNGWHSFETADYLTAHTSQASSGEATVFAAEYVDGYIFGAQTGTDTYSQNNLFVTKAGTWERTTLKSLKTIVYQWPGSTKTYFPLDLIALDMTYDYTSDTMYILANAVQNNYFPEGVENLLLSMDIQTGSWKLLGLIEPATEGETFLALTLACDNDGVLYTINQANGQLYTIDVEGAVSAYGEEVTNIKNPMNIYTATSVDKDGVVSYYPAAYTQSMTFDHETDKLYWAGYQGVMGTSYFLELDKTNGDILAVTRTADNAELDALIKPWNSGKDIVPEAELEYIYFDETELFLNVGKSATITAMPSPYNASLDEIEWTSLDESVATVNKYGVIEATGIGTTVILATCGNFEAECTVNVSDVEGTMFAYSGGYWYLMDAGSPDQAVQIVDTMELDGEVKAAAYHDGYIYASSVSGDYASYSTTIYKLDQNTLSGEALNSFDGEILGLAFSYSDGFLYGILRSYNAETEYEEYDLVRINIKTGDYLVAASLKELYNSENWDLCSGALAIDYNGNFYVNGTNADGWDDIYTLKRFNLDENGEIANVAVYSEFDIMGYNGDAMVWSERNGGIIHVGGNELRWVDVSDMENVNVIDLGAVRGASYSVYALAMPLNSEPALPVVTPVSVSLEESYTAPVGETIKVLPSVEPWNATGEFTFEIADTAIATVDENGVIKGVAEGETTITVTETLSGLTATAKVIIERNPGYLYGYFQAYITEQIPMEVWGKIPVANPGEFIPTTVDTYSLTIYAAAYYDGFVYACGQHNTDGRYYTLKISPANFSYEIIGEPDFLARDMAFDYTTGTMYAVGYDEEVKGGLYTLDLVTGEFTLIADNDMGATLVALACDDEGVLYAADDYGEVVTVDKTTAALQSTGIYGGSSMYFQSMVYDYNNDTLYWAKGGNLYVVDTERARIKSIGSTECSISGLFSVPQVDIELPETVEPAGVVLDEKNTVAVDEDLAIEAVVLPVSVCAMDKSLVWTSSDESIATVDANGVVTGVSVGEVYITATDAKGNSDSILITVTAEHRYFYGYDELSNAWVQFDTDGVIRKSWPDAEGVSPIASAQYIDGVLYAYDEDGYFYSVDTETFERTFLGNGIHGLVADGLEAWDAENGAYYVDGVPYKMIDLDCAVIEGRRGTVTKLYGVMMAYNVSAWLDDFSYIVAELDMATGEIVEIVVQDKLVDNEMSLRPTNLIYRGGYLYTVNGYITGMVTRIDLTTGAVNGTAIFPEYWGDFNGGRSMIEDPLTGIVYAIRDKRTGYIGEENYNDNFSESVLCTIGLGIAKCDVLATVGSNVRLTGMFIK